MPTCCAILILTLTRMITITGHILQDASQTELESVNKRLTDEKGARLLLRNDVDNLMLESKEIERELNGYRPDHDLNSQPQRVYFNAQLTKYIAVTPEHTVIFDKLTENVGGGYNSNTGIFRAPVTGMYLFSLTLLSQGKGRYAQLQLIKNGNEIGRAFGGSDATNQSQTGSVTKLTYLEKNDEVYVKELPGYTGYLCGNGWTSFSGGLI